MNRLILALLFASTAWGQTAHSVVLTWTASTTAGVTYSVYRGTAAGQESATPLNAAAITATTYTDSDPSLAPGTTYFYVVRSVNSAGTSPASNEASGMIPITIVIPSAPNGLTIVIR